ncbi:MAG: hypothetical protein AAF750_09220 [Planctomycetota bacterium]
MKAEAKPAGSRWADADPGFDGALEVPFSALSTEQKLDWLWQVMVLRYETQQAEG